MRFVQFRVHPGVGCARMGNSDKFYYLASEFPYFLQEEFPILRFKPKPRVHPKIFFGGNNTAGTSPPGTLPNIFDTTGAFENKFKEAEGKIFPQAARFRVFAYVFDDANRRHPEKVFEVTPDLADIVWKVNIANKKSQKTGEVGPHENLTTATSDLDTADARLICKRLRPVAGLPNLAYIFLERNDADATKVTGRLHVIGNEGEFTHSGSLKVLWSDDWYDSAGDGSVQAHVKPKPPLRAASGAAGLGDLKYLDFGLAAPQAGTAASVTAMPGWVVVGCPDYVPDMGHFVSLWDVALDRGYKRVELGGVVDQPGKHRLIRAKGEFDTYKQTDYTVHIHPHLCLFEDVRFVSGEANNDPENRPRPPERRAHNFHVPAAGAPPPANTLDGRVKHGGVRIDARARKAELRDPNKLKTTDFSKPINDWLKLAVVSRLRRPGTLYGNRKFIVNPPDLPEALYPGSFPRKLGRRMDYDGGPDKNKFYQFPSHKTHEGNLLKFHGLPDADKLCGKDKSPPTAGPPGSSLSAAELTLLRFMDDMYWPATFRDMPLLRELAYTPLQYKQFEAWAGLASDMRYVADFVYWQVVEPALVFTFGAFADPFDGFQAARPRYAPAMIDMAHLGAMLGGSFMPGIEVGREAGIAENWCLFHGATGNFPSIRFMRADRPADHTVGTLTKDLAVPWTDDFKRCTESWWPTSRPGRTTKDPVTLTRQNWQIRSTDTIPHLGTAAPNDVVFVKEYWKALGFIRRDPTDRFIEREQSWH